MKAYLTTPRNVALLVAAGLIAGSGVAVADTTPTPTPTVKPWTQFQIDRAAYKTALEAFIANRQASMVQFKAAMEAFRTAH